jgi:hypothetical protein
MTTTNTGDHMVKTYPLAPEQVQGGHHIGCESCDKK